MERQVKKLQSAWKKKKWAEAEKKVTELLDKKVEDAVQELLKKMESDYTIIPKE